MPSVFKKYEVVNDKVVYLEVLVGEGQLGHINVYLDGVLIITAKNCIGPTPLSEGSELKGKTLVTSVDVIDVQPATDRTSVTETLTGGVGKQSTRKNKDASGGKKVNYFYETLFV